VSYPMIISTQRNGKLIKSYAGDKPDREYQIHIDNAKRNNCGLGSDIVQVQLVEIMLTTDIRD
jgi:hypothetical protein